ncbi:MAG TPA: NUDIX hydrolase [Puia sp.]|nr:NUDIX hydrolase [Puia sp.]
MYIKIYFNDKPLFLCDELNAEINGYAHHDDAVFIDEFSNPSINSIIHEMRLEKVHAGIFLHKDLNALKKAFWKKFLLVQAAGGLVQNDAGALLFIFRRGKWDLPKGKLDKGENLEQCAIREVREETGLKEVLSTGPLLVTWHTYDESGKHFLKETHWYRMKAPGSQSVVPQAEEQITELKWVGEKELPKYTAHTYPSVVDVLDAAASQAAR